MSIVSASWTEAPGPNLSINCPNCEKMGVPAASYDHKEQLVLFFVLPIFWNTVTYIRCGACDAKLRSQLSCEELVRLQPSAEHLTQFLVPNISIVYITLAIVSMTLFCVPVLGFVLSLITFLLTRNISGWPKTMATVAMILTSIVHAVFLMIALTSNIK